MKDVAVEQVEENKLLGVTLDCKLSRSKHIDSVVVLMGRGLSVIKRWGEVCHNKEMVRGLSVEMLCFLIPPSAKQVLL